MAYFRSLLTVKWPNMIPDALGGARGYSCSPRLLCAWQLPPPFLLLHPLRMRKPHRSQRKRAGVVGSLQGITVIIFQVEKKNNKCIYLFLFVWQSGCNFFSPFLLFFSYFLPSFLLQMHTYLSCDLSYSLLHLYLGILWLWGWVDVWGVRHAFCGTAADEFHSHCHTQTVFAHCHWLIQFMRACELRGNGATRRSHGVISQAKEEDHVLLESQRLDWHVGGKKHSLK